MLSKRNISYIVTGLFVLTALLITIWFMTRPAGKLEFVLAPNNAQLAIDDKTTKAIVNKQKVTLTPGLHTITISRDGFKDWSTQVQIEDGATLRTVVALVPMTDEARSILKDDDSSNVIRAEFKKDQINKLLDRLPLQGANFSITKCDSLKHPGSNTQALCVVYATATSQGKDAAQAILRNLGYDPDDFEILTGTKSAMNVITSSTFRIDHFSNFKGVDASKPTLHISSLTGTIDTLELERIRTAALQSLTDDGYVLDKYEIYYSDFYLSLYNPILEGDGSVEHALLPSR